VASALALSPTPVKTTLTIFRDREHPTRIEFPLFSGKLTSAVAPVIVPDAGVPTGDAGVMVVPAPDAAVRPSEPRDAATQPPVSRPPEVTPRDAGASDVEPEDASTTPRKPASQHCSCNAVDQQTGFGLPGSGFLLLGLVLWARRRRAGFFGSHAAARA
jgi:hypothetical protein